MTPHVPEMRGTFGHIQLDSHGFLLLLLIWVWCVFCVYTQERNWSPSDYEISELSCQVSNHDSSIMSPLLWRLGHSPTLHLRQSEMEHNPNSVIVTVLL